MGCPIKVQPVKCKESGQWYINFPSAVARAMEFERVGIPRDSSIADIKNYTLFTDEKPEKSISKAQPQSLL